MAHNIFKIKKTIVLALTYFAFSCNLSHTTNNSVDVVSTETTQIQSAFDKLLSEYYEYFSNIQDPKQPEELNQKLAHIKEVYKPYLETIKSLSNEKEIETVMAFIFAFDFKPYFLNPSIYLKDKLKCLSHKVKFNCNYFSYLNQEEFIQELPTLAKTPILSLLKNSYVEPNINAFYDFIKEIFADEKDLILKNKISNIKEVFYPYMIFLNGVTQYAEASTAIGFIFAYEYGSLLMQNNNVFLKDFKKQLQPYIDALEEQKGDLKSYDDFIELTSKYAYTIPTLIPNPLIESILNEIFEFCKNKSENGFFRLGINSQKIEQKFKTSELNLLKSIFKKDIFCQLFNFVAKKYIKISHFELSVSHFYVELTTDTVIEYFGEHKDDFTYLKIPNFTKGFNGKQIETILTEVAQRNNNLILDLRNNPGGLMINLMYLLSFFFSPDTVLAYQLTREHESFLGYENLTQMNYSPENIKSMIENLKKNWNKTQRSFELTIDQTKKNIEIIKAEFSHQAEKLEENYKEKSKLLKCLQDSLSFNFHNEPVKGKIAILFNYESASCAQLTLLFLKTFFPERVKTIGDHFIGQVTPAQITHLSNSDLYFLYPTTETIMLDYSMGEGLIHKPDLYLTDPNEMMKAAEEWVRKK